MIDRSQSGQPLLKQHRKLHSALILACALNDIAALPALETCECSVDRTPCPNHKQSTFCASNPSPHQCDPGGCNTPAPEIPDFEELECAMHQLAFEVGASKTSTSRQALLGGLGAKSEDEVRVMVREDSDHQFQADHYSFITPTPQALHDALMLWNCTRYPTFA